MRVVEEPTDQTPMYEVAPGTWLGPTMRPGYGGWLEWRMPGLPAKVYVRFAEAGKPPNVIGRGTDPGYPGPPGRLVMHDLFITGPGMDMPPPAGRRFPLPADVLRRIPLGQIEAWANGTGAEAIRHLMDRRPGPELRAAVSRFVKVAPKDQRKRPAEVTSLRLSKKHHAIAAGRKRPYPDEFYEAVAGIYQAAAGSSRGPATLIADANGVEPGTVHRWVRMARKRGFLPPAPAKGKAG
jgi:hypothetical protein